MDINTFQEIKRGRNKLPLALISRDHALADPNRPSLVSEAETAKSLYEHLSKSLLAKEPTYNPMWQALAHTARSVISLQEVDDTKNERVKEMLENQARSLRAVTGGELVANRDPSEMSDEALANLVKVASISERVTRQIAESNIPADKRVDALRTIERLSINETANGPAPTRADLEKIPGLAAVWNGPEGRNYRTAMRTLAESARLHAADINQEVSRMNETVDPGEEQIKPVKSRDVLSGWIGSMTAQAPGTQQTWTNDYAVAMTTNEESVVAKGFIDIAMKAVREGRTPTLAELRADIGALHAQLSRPEVRFIDGTEREAVGNRIVEKHFVRAAVVRPAITGRTHDWRKGARVSAQSQEAAERSLTMAGKPIIGIEGQPYYDNVEAIKAAMMTLKGHRRATPAMITHATDGTPFRSTIEEAAKAANVGILKAEMRIETSRTLTQSEATIDHVDGKYSAESIIGRKTVATVWIKDAPVVTSKRDVNPKTGVVNMRKVTEKKDVPLDSAEGRRAALGHLIIVEPGKAVDSRQQRAMATAMENHAALAPNAMILAVRANRGNDTARMMTYEIARVVHRRTLSGRSAPFAIGKDGQRVSKVAVSQTAASLGATASERNAREVSAIEINKLSFTDPQAQLLVTQAIGAERAAILAARFQTVGEVIQTARAALNDPKSEQASAPGGKPLTKEEKFAIGDLNRAFENSAKFKASAERAANIVHAAEIESATVIADPSNKMVSRHGPLIGLVSDNIGDHAKLPSVAIVGDKAEVTPALAENIRKAIDDLAARNGRDEQGVAKFRITTTMTHGVGEEVMKAAIEKSVPVLAVTHIDDRALTATSPEIELLKLAMKAKRANLGGMATLDTYVAGREQPTADKALRAAMDGAEAVVVARAKATDRELVTYASVGRDKPLMVMGASEADPVAYGGNNLLRKPGVTLTAEIAPADRQVVYANAEVSQSRVAVGKGDESRMPVYENRTFATTTTVDGALQLSSAKDFALLSQAMAGKGTHLTVDRGESIHRDEPEAGTKLRFDVLDKVDIARFADKDYAKELERFRLTPEERKHLQKSHIDLVYFSGSAGSQIEPEYVKDMLATKFRVKGHTVETHDSGYGR